MPINSSHVGEVGRPVTEEIEPRWAMNFAASIGDTTPALYATDKGELPVHPIFLDYALWEATRNVMEKLALTGAERARGVAAGLDQIMHRPLRTGMQVSTTAKLIGIKQHRAGAQVDKLIETWNGSDLVCTTILKSIFRDVEIEGGDVTLDFEAEKYALVAKDAGQIAAKEEILLPPHFCHLYSECGRAFNPIHTDIAIAKSAGLPGLILHGSATMALAVSEVAKRFAGGDVTRIARLSGNYRAMVLVPGVITVEIEEPIQSGDIDDISFTVLTQEGKPAIANGRIALVHAS